MHAFDKQGQNPSNSECESAARPTHKIQEGIQYCGPNSKLIKEWTSLCLHVCLSVCKCEKQREREKWREFPSETEKRETRIIQWNKFIAEAPRLPFYIWINGAFLCVTKTEVEGVRWGGPITTHTVQTQDFTVYRRVIYILPVPLCKKTKKKSLNKKKNSSDS